MARGGSWAKEFGGMDSDPDLVFAVSYLHPLSFA